MLKVIGGKSNVSASHINWNKVFIVSRVLSTSEKMSSREMKKDFTILDNLGMKIFANRERN